MRKASLLLLSLLHIFAAAALQHSESDKSASSLLRLLLSEGGGEPPSAACPPTHPGCGGDGQLSSSSPAVRGPGAMTLPPASGSGRLVAGVPAQEIPPHLMAAALMREHLTYLSKFPDEDPLTPRLRDGLDATAFCITQECVQLMKEFEEWQRANGYGTPGGRWG